MDDSWIPYFVDEGTLDKFELPPLKSALRGKSDLEVRIWEFGELTQALVITRVDGTWAGQRGGKFLPLSGDPTKTVDDLSTPLSGWEGMWTKLTELGLLTLPDDTQLEPSAAGGVRGGTTFVVELNVDGRYRTFHYGNPAWNPAPEAKKMIAISEFLKAEFACSTASPCSKVQAIVDDPEWLSEGPHFRRAGHLPNTLGEAIAFKRKHGGIKAAEADCYTDFLKQKPDKSHKILYYIVASSVDFPPALGSNVANRVVEAMADVPDGRNIYAHCLSLLPRTEASHAAADALFSDEQAGVNERLNAYAALMRFAESNLTEQTSILVRAIDSGVDSLTVSAAMSLENLGYDIRDYGGPYQLNPKGSGPAVRRPGRYQNRDPAFRPAPQEP